MITNKDITEKYYADLITFFIGSENASSKVDVSNPNAKNIIQKINSYYKCAIEELKEITQARYGDPDLSTMFSDNMAKATATTSSFLAEMKAHNNSKLLRDVYVNLTAASCGLQMLYATDKADHGDTVASSKLLELLTKHHNLITETNKILPQVVVEELACKEDEFSSRDTHSIVSDLQLTWK